MKLTLEQLQRALAEIHARPPKVVLEFAGAGAQALAWLHGVGGSSRTILEATDRYAETSLWSAIGFKPKQATSPQVARAMAMRAYIRARELTPANIPVAGVGCTATIATDRAKRGQHRCFIALCDGQGVVVYGLELAKGYRTRHEEEHLVSLLILRAIADLCAVTSLPEPALTEQETLTTVFEPADLLLRLLAQEVDWVLLDIDGQLTTAEQRPNIALLSGSFNPLHAGHRQLAQVAADILGQAVYFELPLVNAEKAPIDLREARRRTAQFSGIAPLLLTGAPLFNQKARFFPNSVFIIGVDTAARLIQDRFYNHNPAEMAAAFDDLKAAGCRFLVAGRSHGDKFLTLSDLDLPAYCRDLFTEIPPDRFRHDISSTAIRAVASS